MATRTSVSPSSRQARQTARWRAYVLARDRYRCQLCGRGYIARYLEIDHVIPAADNGPTIPENLRVVCRACHLARHRMGDCDDR